MSLSLLRNCLKSVTAAVIFMTAVLLALNAVVLGCPDPDKYLSAAACAALIAGALVCGIVCVRLNGGGALLCGLISGSVLLLLVLLVSLCVRNGEPFSPLSLVMCAAAPLSGCLGGFIGMPRRPSSESVRKNLTRGYAKKLKK